MSGKGVSRRQFVTGAAVAAAATTVPVLSNVSIAAGTPSIVFPLATDGWTPLDPKAVARQGWEIYKGMYSPAQSG